MGAAAQEAARSFGECSRGEVQVKACSRHQQDDEARTQVQESRLRSTQMKTGPWVLLSLTLCVPVLALAQTTPAKDAPPPACVVCARRRLPLSTGTPVFRDRAEWRRPAVPVLCPRGRREPWP